MNGDVFQGQYQSAAKLKQFLDETRPHTPALERDGIPQEESEWAASHLLTSLLENAVPRSPALTHGEAQRLLDANDRPAALEELAERGYVRFVLGRLEIPYAVWSAARAQNPEKDLAWLLEPIRLLSDAKSAKNRFWISQAEAEALRNQHAAAHPRTPELDGLAAIGATAPIIHGGQPGFLLTERLDDRPSLWQSLTQRVAAHLWVKLCGNAALADDQARVERWLERVTDLEDWFEAPDHMSQIFRDRLIAAAWARTMREPDLVGRVEEARRVQLDTDLPLRTGYRLDPPPGEPSSLLEAWRWWEQLEQMQRILTCRRRSDGLLRIASWPARHDWRSPLVVEWLVASRNRPYLMSFLTVGRNYTLRSNLVTLLFNVDTISLGLALIKDLAIDNAAGDFWQDQSTRNAWYDEKRNAVWDTTATIVAQTLANVQDEQQAVVQALGEVLLLAAQDVEARRWVADEDDAGARRRFDALFDAFQATGFLPDLVGPLRTWLSNDAAVASEQSDTSESLPVPRLKVLFSLLRALSADRKEAAATAHDIVRLYAAELKRWGSAGGGIVNWYRSGERLASLPWGDVAQALLAVQQPQIILKPDGVHLEAKLGGVEEELEALPADARERERHDRTRNWLNKIRCHLRVLFRIHDILNSQDDYEELLRGVEGRVQDLVVASAAADPDADRPGLFDPRLDELTGEGNGTASFAEVAVQAINRFNPAECVRTFAVWTERETHPVILLRIAESTVATQARDAAVAQLERFDLNAFLDDQYWIPSFERLVEAAALAERTELARRVLKFVEDLGLNERQRPDWDVFAYRMRLMLAYHERDIEGLRTLDPPTVEGAGRNQSPASLRQSLERSRRFYRALLDLERDPAKAEETFDDLLRLDPGSAANAVNRFAAAVRFASRQDDEATRVGEYSRSLRDWDEAARAIPERGQREVLRQSSYSRLVALDGARRDLEFDRAWEALPTDLKADLSFVGVAVNNATRRGHASFAQVALNRARPYHIGVNGQVSETFQALEREVRAGQPIETRDLVVGQPAPEFMKLRGYWGDLVGARIEDFVRAVADRPDTTPHRYLADALLAVARELLDRVHLFQGFNENGLSDVLWSLLRQRLARPWEVEGQSRGGSSEGGKDAGERDAVVRFKGMDIAILEALRLDSVNQEIVSAHITKAMTKYNPVGVNHVYLISYFQGKKWSDFWQKYYDHIRSVVIEGVSLDLDSCISFPNAETGGVNLQLAYLVYRRENHADPLIVYHLAINLSETSGLSLGKN